LAHADHLFVRDAALGAAAGWTPPARILLYEELPYLMGGVADREVRRLARRAGLRADPLELQVDPIRKAERIGRYTSQLGHLTDDGTRLDDPALLPPTERYWILRPR
jgi:hypothetical protein